MPLALQAPASRWSLSAWAFVRAGGAAPLAAAGTLGGSQAGARLSYNVARGVALSARAYAPFGSRGAEAAIGVDWQPLRAAPVHILLERRERLQRNGRSAFSLLAYGGVSEHRVVGPVVADLYAQAGIVGARARDAFVDGALRLSVPIGDRVAVGAGAWGAAQPGVERFDAGPQLGWRLPVGGNLRLLADYRIRVAGNAAPASGPTLTLAADF